MRKESSSVLQRERVGRLLSHYPDRLLHAIRDLALKMELPLFITGGALRDWLRGEVPNDLDFTIARGASDFLGQVRKACGTGTIVALGERHDDTCRLVFRDVIVDVSGFRKGTETIENDLLLRDFTVNALAVEACTLFGDGDDIPIIDPLRGLEDMRREVIRVCPGAFQDDPLRMLRAFRFAALLDYEIDGATLKEIAAYSHLIGRSAAERIRYECDQMMQTPRAYQAMTGMAAVGLLEHVIPELYRGDGVSQPAFHHLDVLQHNLLALACMERVISAPAQFYPSCHESMMSYLEDQTTAMLLKWSALFHDVGKPDTREVVSGKDNRITFYGHDREGGKLFLEFAERLRWSKRSRQRVSELITMHMHPFHLCNVLRETGDLSRRARLKICRRAGDELPGLFLLAVADSLAGQGVEKPEGMEEELDQLYCSLDRLYQGTVRPVIRGPKLLTGYDLIATLGLEPGPHFSEILNNLDTAVMEGRVVNREEAIAWVRTYLGVER